MADTINQIIGQEAFEQTERLNTDLQTLVATMNQAAETAKLVKLSIRSETDIKTLLSEMDKLKQSAQQLSTQSAQFEKVRIESARESAKVFKDSEQQRKQAIELERINADQVKKTQSAIEQLNREKERSASITSQQEAQAQKEAIAQLREREKLESINQTQIKKTQASIEQLNREKQKSASITSQQEVQAQKEAIQQLRDREKLESINQTQIKRTQAAIEQLNKERERSASVVLKQEVDSQKEAIAQLREREKLERANQAQAKSTQAAINKIERDRSRANAQMEKELAKIEKERSKAIQAAQREANAYEQLKREYTEAANRAKALASEYFNLQRSGKATTDQLMKMGHAVRDANKEALGLSKGLYEIERGVGQSQRNVGNYNALMFETNQLLREAPNFALSARTGFMALSNNLPMFADQWRNVARSIDDTTGKMKGWRGAMREVGRSILSWQTLLIVGITLMLQYGDQIGDFFEKLFTGKRNIDALKESQKALNEAFQSSEITDAISNVITLTEKIDLAKRGFISKDKVVKQYNESIGRTTGFVESLEEAEAALIRNKDKYIEMMVQKAAANLMVEKAAKAQAEAMEAELNPDNTVWEKMGVKAAAGVQRVTAALAAPALAIKSLFGDLDPNDPSLKIYIDSQSELLEKYNKGKIKELNDQGDEYQNIAKKLFQNAADIAKEMGFSFDEEDKQKKGKVATDRTNAELKLANDLLEIDRDLYVQMQKEQAAYYKSIYEDQTKSLDERLSAYEEYVTRKLGISRAETSGELMEATIALEKIGEIERKKASSRTKQEVDLLAKKEYYNKRISLLEMEQASRENEIIFESTKERTRIFEQFTQGQMRMIQEQFDSIKNMSDAEVAVSLANLNEKKERGLMTEREYWKERRKIMSEGSKEVYKWQQEFLQELYDQIVNDPNMPKEVRDWFVRFYGEVEKQKAPPSDRSLLEMLGFGSKTEEEMRATVAREVQNLYNTLFQAINQARDQQYQRQFDQLDEEKRRIEENAEAERKAVEGSLMSQEEKQKRLDDINARALANERVNEAQRRQMMRERAVREKQDAIFQASLQGGIAIAKAISGAAANPVLAAAAAALIAAQTAANIAVISSRPIPSYWTGTDNHPGGPAWVGEKGTEKVTLPSGQVFFTPPTATLMELPKHTKVTTHEKTVRELREKESGAVHHHYDARGVDKTLVSERLSKEAQRLSIIRMGETQSAVNEFDYAEAMIASMDEAMARHFGKLSSTIKGKKETHFHWDNGQLRKSVKNGNDWMKYID